MENNQNDTEKFYDTYGKNASFESFPEETTIPLNENPESAPAISVMNKVRKYLAVALFLTVAITMMFIGGFFILIFLGVMLLGMVIRSIFYRSNGPTNSSFIVIKK